MFSERGNRPERIRSRLNSVARTMSAAIIAAGAFSCNSESNSNSSDSNSVHQRKVTDLEFPFTTGDWRLTNGPHSELFGGSILSSLDFAPGEITHCDPNSQDEIRYEDDWITSPIEGEIVLVGGSDVNSTTHSLLEIKMDKNPNAQIMMAHLTNIQVEKGEHVEIGEKLGHVSCAHTPQESSTGVHLHIGFRNADKPADISQAKILIGGEWEISGTREVDSNGFYQGRITNVRDGREVIADGRVCGPDDKLALIDCGHNNFIPKDALIGQITEDIDETPFEPNNEESCVENDIICDDKFISSLGFEAPIPDGWTFQNISSKNGQLQERFFPSDTNIKAGITVTVENTNGQSLSFYKAWVEEGLRGTKLLGFPANIQEINNIEIDEIEGEEFKGDFAIEDGGEYSGNYNFDYIIFIKNDKLWTLTFAAQNIDEFGEDFENFLEQFNTLQK